MTGRRASNGPRSITVQDEVSVNKASANSSGVATFGPIDCLERDAVGASKGYRANRVTPGLGLGFEGGVVGHPRACVLLNKRLHEQLGRRQA